MLGYGTLEGTNPEDTKGLEDPERKESQQPEPAQHLLGVVGPLWKAQGYQWTKHLS